MKSLKPKTTKKPAKAPASAQQLDAQTKLTLLDHFRELRRRVTYVGLSIAVWSGIAYGFEHTVIDVLLRPSHGQHFIYTSPIGGMNFLLRVCLYVGLAMSIPVAVYHLLRYVEPLMKGATSRFIIYGSAASGVLALAGILFGYFIGLPAALHFLLHQFVTSQVQPLLTIEAYLSFVIFYMLGAMLMFQLPLIVLFIHRIKPQTPQSLFRYERWVILFAVVLAFIMNPTTRLLDQLLIALPIVLSYQFSIGLIWWTKWHQQHDRQYQIALLRQKDEAVRLERQARLQKSVRPTVQSTVRSTGVINGFVSS
jgi:sec-independent protein translocase protein TatC